VLSSLQEVQLRAVTRKTNSRNAKPTRFSFLQRSAPESWKKIIKDRTALVEPSATRDAKDTHYITRDFNGLRPSED